MSTRDRITDKRFSVALCSVAENLGFVSVGPFYRFLKKCKSPSIKLYYGTSYIRAYKLINEIDRYLDT